MRDNMIYLSLCIPTNGISEWVFPVLESIFNQQNADTSLVDTSLYEVIVTNNGNDEAFHVAMEEYAKKHENLKYKKTNAFLFENQIEALRLAKGEFLKFLNHRAVLEDGALEWMLDVVKGNMATKPVMYLSNGALGFDQKRSNSKKVLNMKQEDLDSRNHGNHGDRRNHQNRREYNDFDGFVRGLKHYASWTTGVGVWRSDFEKIPHDWVYNKISPHSDVLFFERHKEKYIIDDRIWSREIDNSHKNKGKYDLYKAFAVEEISITLGLFLNGDISAETLKIVIEAYKDFVASCYLSFNILRRPCSYKLDGFNDAIGIFMGKKEIIIRALTKALSRVIRRFVRKIVKQ